MSYGGQAWLRAECGNIFFISEVAASVSEWQLIHSLTLAATT